MVLFSGVMTLSVTIGEHSFSIKNINLAEHTADVNGMPVRFDFKHIHGELYSLLVNDRSYSVQINSADGADEIRLGPHIFNAVVEDAQSLALRRLKAQAQPANSDVIIKAPMPGLITRILTAPGETVRAGQALIVIEAMKMENELKAPSDGVIAEVLAEAQSPVDKGAVLIKIKSA